MDVDSADLRDGLLPFHPEDSLLARVRRPSLLSSLFHHSADPSPLLHPASLPRPPSPTPSRAPSRATRPTRSSSASTSVEGLCFSPSRPADPSGPSSSRCSRRAASRWSSRFDVFGPGAITGPCLTADLDPLALLTDDNADRPADQTLGAHQRVLGAWVASLASPRLFPELAPTMPLWRLHDAGRLSQPHHSPVPTVFNVPSCDALPSLVRRPAPPSRPESPSPLLLPAS